MYHSYIITEFHYIFLNLNLPEVLQFHISRSDVLNKVGKTKTMLRDSNSMPPYYDAC